MADVTRVLDLLTADGSQWDIGKVDAMFTESDACDIKQTPVGGPSAADIQAWNFTKDGCFTVRSAYHLAMSKERLKFGRPSSSSPAAQHKSWLTLWGTRVPNKVKLHFWRLMRNGLAVGNELERRSIKRGMVCPSVLLVAGRKRTFIGAGSALTRSSSGSCFAQNREWWWRSHRRPCAPRVT